MTDWTIWLVLAGLAIVVELCSGTFYLLMIALGLAAGGVLAAFGATLEWQLLAAAVVGFAAVGGLRRSRFGRRRSVDPAHDPNINLDIGQTVHIAQWQAVGEQHLARIRYRGAAWDVELAAGGTAQAGNFVIREVRGSRLIVSPP